MNTNSILTRKFFTWYTLYKNNYNNSYDKNPNLPYISEHNSTNDLIT